MRFKVYDAEEKRILFELHDKAKFSELQHLKHVEEGEPPGAVLPTPQQSVPQPSAIASHDGLPGRHSTKSYIVTGKAIGTGVNATGPGQRAAERKLTTTPTRGKHQDEMKQTGEGAGHEQSPSPTRRYSRDENSGSLPPPESPKPAAASGRRRLSGFGNRSSGDVSTSPTGEPRLLKPRGEFPLRSEEEKAAVEAGKPTAAVGQPFAPEDPNSQPGTGGASGRTRRQLPPLRNVPNQLPSPNASPR